MGTDHFASRQDPSVYCPGANWEPVDVSVGYYSVGGGGGTTRTGQVYIYTSFEFVSPYIRYSLHPKWFSVFKYISSTDTNST